MLNGYGSPAYSVCDKMPWYGAGRAGEIDPVVRLCCWMRRDGPLGSGIPHKDGLRAELRLLYPASDSVKEDAGRGLCGPAEKLWH